MKAQGTQFFKLPTGIAGRTDIGSTAKIVFAVISDAARGGVARIGVNRIARLAGVDRTTALRARQELERAGCLDIQRGRNGQRCLYRLNKTSRKTPPVSESNQSHSATGSQNPTSRVSPPDQSHSATGTSRVSPLRSEETYIQTKSGGAHQTLIDHFCNSWAARFGAKYPFSKSKDPPAAKRLLDALSGDVERATRVVDRYLAGADEWTAKQGCRLAVLASNAQLPRYLTATAPTPNDTANAESEHPLIEAGRAKWPESVESDPEWWVGLAHRVENPRSKLNLQRAKRLIREAKTLEAFKATVSGKEAASASA